MADAAPISMVREEYLDLADPAQCAEFGRSRAGMGIGRLTLSDEAIGDPAVFIGQETELPYVATRSNGDLVVPLWLLALETGDEALRERAKSGGAWQPRLVLVVPREAAALVETAA